MTAKNNILIELFENRNGNKQTFQYIKAELVNETEANTTMEFVLSSFGTIKLTKLFSLIPETIQKNVTVNETTELVEEVVENKVQWNISVNYELSGRMSPEERYESSKKLDQLDEQEENIKKRAQAKNDYESLIYSSRDWLTNDENQKYILADVKTELLEFLKTVLYTF